MDRKGEKSLVYDIYIYMYRNQRNPAFLLFIDKVAGRSVMTISPICEGRSDD